jgi:integrase/recombinase XerD
MLVDEAQTGFIQWLEARGLSGHTVRAYTGDVALLGAFMREHSNVDTLSHDLVVRFVERQRARGLSDASVRRRLATVKIFSKWLADYGALMVDPCAGLSLRLPTGRRLPRSIPKGELNRLLLHLCDASKLSPGKVCDSRLSRPHQATTLVAVALMVATGLRVSEVAALGPGDVDLMHRSVHVTGKGRRDRTVYLPGQWIPSVIRGYVQARKEAGVAHDSLLFNRHLEPLTPAATRARLVRAGEDAGMARRLTPHMLQP